MRYFIETTCQGFEIEQLIERNKIEEMVFQVVIREAKSIKRFTWFLLKNDISFKRESLGSGITIFFVDMAIPFFVRKRKK
jgi:hypothetical protein